LHWIWCCVHEQNWKANKVHSWIGCKYAPTGSIDFIYDTKLWNKSDRNQRGFRIIFHPKDVLKPWELSSI
jgi:hypothetical protein